jgi:hypothetical protein
MSEPQLPREVRRRLAIIRHAEEVTGNVAITCRYRVDRTIAPTPPTLTWSARSSTSGRTTTSVRARSRCTSRAVAATERKGASLTPMDRD